MCSQAGSRQPDHTSFCLQSPSAAACIAPRQGRYHNLSLALHMHSDRLPCRLQSPLMPLNVPKLTARLTR